MSSHLNRSFTCARLLTAATAVLSVLLFALPARAQGWIMPPEPPEMCGDVSNTLFTVDLPVVDHLPGGGIVAPLATSNADTLMIPKGCNIYLLIASDLGRNRGLDELSFYPLAKFVAQHNGYVHYSWWNNILKPYMGGPTHSFDKPEGAVSLFYDDVFRHPGERFKTDSNEVYRTLCDHKPTSIGTAICNAYRFLSDAVAPYQKRPFPDSTRQFTADAAKFVETVRDENPEAVIIVAGHGLGGHALSLIPTARQADIDLMALIDPYGSTSEKNGEDVTSSEGVGGLRSRTVQPIDYYRQWNCERNAFFKCINDGTLFNPKYRCFQEPEKFTERPLIGSWAPIACGTSPKIYYKIREIAAKRLYYRWQTEIGPPNDYASFSTVFKFTGQEEAVQSRLPHSASYVAGQLCSSDIVHPLNPLNRWDSTDERALRCGPADGHDEMVGIVTSRMHTTNFLGVEYAADWRNPAGVLARSQGEQLANYEHCSPMCDGRELDRIARKEFLVEQLNGLFFAAHVYDLASDLCLVCDDLVGIAQELYDEQQAEEEGEEEEEDTTAPVTTADPDPDANPQRWHDTDVNVTLTATDAGGVDKIVSSLTGAQPGSETTTAGDTAIRSISTEGATTITFFARDTAGNSETPQSLEVQIDKTPPNITAIPDPQPNSRGWNREDVRVSFVASDALSGIASVEPERVVSTEGLEQEVGGPAEDLAGNIAGASVILNIDKTPPQIAAEPNVAANSFGWNNSDVIVSFPASDALSGLFFTSPETPVSTEGAGQEIPGTATDNADNTATASIVLNIDKTPPQIAAVPNIAPNSFGWNNTDVRVSFVASDALSGLASTSPETLVTAEGTGHPITGTATDRADNTAEDSVTVNIDKTAPQIAAVPNIAPNSHGWHNTDVVVRFEASDALSGIAVSSPDEIVATEGAGRSVSGEATDRADNTASASLVLNIDKTAPAIALANRTPANGAGWNNTDVTLTWNCSDALSGPVVNQVSHSLSAEGATQNATGHCEDRAGHTAGDTQSGINIDKTSPTSQITTPANGAVYLLNAVVNAAYDCADALSGVSACVGGVASGAALDTTTAGDKTFTVSAADAAGNQAAASQSYSVQYAFSGFSNPIAALPAINTANAGRTVPVKYSLRDVNGAVISDLTSFVSLISAPVACDTNVPTAEAEETDAAGSTTIRFESGQFIYNWKTQSAWAGTCRMLQLTLTDGTRHMVSFQFK